MTTEIAVLNKSGVALAADSAVTTHSKVLQSADKIFSLSKVEPIGIMIYSSAHFMDVPWHTIIKLYRENLKNRKFSLLSEYADDFFQFLKINIALKSAYLKESYHVENNVANCFLDITRHIEQRIKNLTGAYGKISLKQTRQEYKKIFSDFYSYLDGLQNLNISQKISFQKFCSDYKNNLDRAFKLIEKFSYGRAFKAKYYDAAYKICTKKFDVLADTGLVFVGFGEDEIFPQIETYRVRGMFANELQYYRQEEECSSISADRISQVIGFAQKDIISLFMDGVHPDIRNLFLGALKIY